MKTSTNELRVSPETPVRESDGEGQTKEISNNKVSTVHSYDMSGRKPSRIADLGSAKSQTTLLHLSRNESSSKISTSCVKVAFATQQRPTSETSQHKNHSVLGSLGKHLCFPFKVEFPSRNLELIYEHYYNAQKQNRILYIICLDFLVNLALLSMYCVFLDKSNPTEINRLIVTCFFGLLNLVLIALYAIKLLPDKLIKLLPYFVWFTVFCQLTVDLAIGYDPLVPSDSVGMFMFFMFITYVMLPARLPVCAGFAVFAGVGHLIVIGTVAQEKNLHYLERQVST